MRTACVGKIMGQEWKHCVQHSLVNWGGGVVVKVYAMICSFHFL